VNAKEALSRYARMEPSMVSIAMVVVSRIRPLSLSAPPNGWIDAEFMILRREVAVRIPVTADPASVAPLLCAGVTVFAALRKAKIPAGELIGVQGVGGLGHLAVQYASKMGYQVAVISRSSEKEKFAKELGAAFYIDESKENAAGALQKLGGAAGILCTAPSPTVIGPLINGLQAHGRLIVLAGKSIKLHSSWT
jgi:D-arabinose 1-dehydrogenase-like Zn-dependent alcohol dehydrogenase